MSQDRLTPCKSKDLHQISTVNRNRNEKISWIHCVGMFNSTFFSGRVTILNTSILGVVARRIGPYYQNKIICYSNFKVIIRFLIFSYLWP